MSDMTYEFGPFPHWLTIDDEVTDIKQRPRLLNNFPGMLPFGGARKNFDYVLHPDRVDRALATSGERDQRAIFELFGDIEEAICLHGINRARIERLQVGISSNEAAYSELITMTLPVYVDLREQGYSYTELKG